MAGFTALGLGLLLGGVAGAVAGKKLAPKPTVMEKAAGMLDKNTGVNPGTGEIPKPASSQAAASAGQAAGQGAAVRTRKRVAAGAQSPTARMRSRLGSSKAPAASANLSSASLIGY